MSRPAFAPVLAALIVLALPSPLPAQAQPDRSIAIFAPEHRLADELLPVARAALAGQGEAMLDRGRNALVLVGPAAALAQAQGALAELDRPRRSVLVHWELRRLDALAESAGIVWQAGASLRVGRVEAHGTLPAARARAVETTRENEQRGLLRILDGETGEIASGRSVPVRSFAALDFVVGSSGLLASPRVLRDGSVELSLEAGRARVEARGEVAFTEARTRVRVRPGETILVGGLGAARREMQSGRSLTAGGDETVLLLSVELD